MLFAPEVIQNKLDLRLKINPTTGIRYIDLLTDSGDEQMPCPRTRDNEQDYVPITPKGAGGDQCDINTAALVIEPQPETASESQIETRPILRVPPPPVPFGGQLSPLPDGAPPPPANATAVRPTATGLFTPMAAILPEHATLQEIISQIGVLDDFRTRERTPPKDATGISTKSPPKEKSE